MTKPRRTIWSKFARTDKSVKSARQRGGMDRAGWLAARAGLADGIGAFEQVELLEPRQLLAVVATIPASSVDPATGLGFARVDLAYATPYYQPIVGQMAQPTLVTENFDDETAQWTMNVPPVPPNGTFFATSNIQIAYSSVSAAPVRLLTRTVGANMMDKGLYLQLSTTDTVTFGVYAQGTGGNNQLAPREVRALNFTVSQAVGGTPGGLNTDITTGTRLELLRAGQVVATFRGQALANLAQQVFLPIGPATRFNINFDEGFDSIRFKSAQDAPNNASYADTFIVEEINTTLPGGEFTETNDKRLSSFTAIITGPAGAEFELFDIYGRPFSNIAPPPDDFQGPNPLDPLDTGKPRANDGIGKIVFRNTDARTSFSITGPGVTDITQGFDDLEMNGFGYFNSREQMPSVIGLPSTPGSVVIGSPFVRPMNSLQAYRNAGNFNLVPDDFNRSDQGLFTEGGASMGAIFVDGILHGSSVIQGAAQRVSVGLMVGSLRVEGDLGVFSSATDAGLIFRDDDAMVNNNGYPTIATGGRLTIGRTVREIAIGGRNAMNVSVLADINSPTRARLNFIDFISRERVFGLATPSTVETTINVNSEQAALNPLGLRNFLPQASTFGSGYYRNDELASAEYVGYNGTRVRVFGRIGGSDPVNTADDRTDVFAFPADPSREVVISAISNADTFGAFGGFLGFSGTSIRVVDHDGRVVAAIDQGNVGRGSEGNLNRSNLLRFRPDRADTYYLVLNAPPSGVNIGAAYGFSITGMAPVTLGAFRTSAGSGIANTPSTFTLGAGSMGMLGIGVGNATSDGGIEVGAGINTNQGADISGSWGRATISVPGNLYNVTTGFDIGNAQVGTPDLVVGGDLGTLTTGSLAGGNILLGDVYNLNLRTGGTIGTLDIKGGLGIDQIPMGPNDPGNGVVSIVTGTANGRRGDIGQILVGSYVSGTFVNISMSANSQLDVFRVGTRNGGAGSEYPGQIRNQLPTITSGVGSDVRFIDVNNIDRPNAVDTYQELFIGQTLTLVDDAGASVRISIGGGRSAPVGQPQPTAGSFVQVRTVSINGSRGVAIARISARLFGGADLIIESTSAGVVSIGRIEVLSTDGDASPPTPTPDRSDVLISGVGEVDVYEIRTGDASNNLASGDAIGLISNTTIGGDIVAIDAIGVKNIAINGHLGKTQTSTAGPDQIGPFRGIVADGSGVGGPLTVRPEAINVENFEDWATEKILLPVNPREESDWDGTPKYLEDVGSPIDLYLNGVVVRQGDLFNVQVRGSVGDVLVESGHLINLVANSDGISPTGVFEGVEGSIYAVAIGTVDLGGGLRGTGVSPFASAGVFSDSGILNVFANRVNGAIIEGAIIAGVEGVNDGAALTELGTENPQALPQGLFGIGTVSLQNGRYDGALIQAHPIDDFWGSSRVRDLNWNLGDIQTVRGINSELFRSSIGGLNVVTVNITGGAYDATLVSANGSIGSITADEFRNSTRLGEPAEFFTNRITATRNLGTLATNESAGDISDLTIELGGSITNSVAARNVERASFAVDNFINLINVTKSFRGSSIVSGNLRALTVGDNIRSSELRIAGPIEVVTAGNEITQLEVQSTGPDGRVDLLRAQNLLNANVTSSGDIGTIESVTNDVIGSIETRNDILRPRNGGLASLRAGRNLLVDLSILGSAQSIFAFNNIGRFNEVNKALDIRGNLGTITSQNGQIYPDLVVGQSITGSYINGRVEMRGGADRLASGSILVFGRINSLVFNGDFGADIISRSGGIGSIVFNEGSLRPSGSIVVSSGNLDSFTLNGGDLLGDVTVDGNIGRIDLVARNGFRGHIGVANTKRNFNPAGADRNQLPPGVQSTTGVDGVIIKAGGSIGTINVANGGIWESQIIAGTTIDQIIVAQQIRNDRLTSGVRNAIVAGDRVNFVQTGNSVAGLAVLAGIVDLGADGRVGGIGDDLDTGGPGSIGTVIFGGASAANTVVAAGVSPDPSTGLYTTPGARGNYGRSGIDSVSSNSAIQVSALADGPLGFTSAGIIRKKQFAAQDQSLVAAGPGTGLPGEVQLVNGVAFAFRLASGERGNATLFGPGKAFWDAANNRIRLLNTTLASSLLINAREANFNLTDLTVLTNRNAALGAIQVNGNLRGNSTVFIDHQLTNGVFGNIDTTGVIGAGANIQSLTFGRISAGTIQGRDVGSFMVQGDFGRSALAARGNFLRVGSVNVQGNIAGAISSIRTIDSLVARSINFGGVTSAGSITTSTIGSMLSGRLAALSSLGTVNIANDATESSILGGVFLGDDADFGGTGDDADRLAAGSVGTVTVGGNFRKSDVGAGVTRGASGFLGSDDVAVSAGRSSIGTVTIGGTQVGSSLNSEQYRVISTGSIGEVRVGGLPFTGQGNFLVDRRDVVAVPVTVGSITVSEDSRVYTATISFNQAIDVSTISAALSVIELRNGGATTIGLAEGTDYTLRWDKVQNELNITFSRAVTERNLPQQPGIPGPGVYQFVLSAAVLRGSTQDSLLDGDNNGAPGDDWTRNAVIGDAGDKITAGIPSGAPTIDFYGAADLDLVLRNRTSVGSVPETNTIFTVNGVIGDHPDSDPDIFRLGSDVDVYKISLRAGQILRLGEIQGVAVSAFRGLFNSAGNAVADADALTLPSNGSVIGGSTPETQVLIRQTGTYYIVVAGSGDAVNIANINTVPNVDAQPGAIGRYSFEVSIVDDGDSGFFGDTNSGTGAAVAYAPVPAVFAGTDGIFGTGDDLKVFTTGDWTFTLKKHNESNPGGRNAVVSGTNSLGWLSERRSAANGTFGTAGDRITVNISSSIGLPGSVGNPTDIAPDVDVFRLNNGQPIAAGTRMRATLRLTELGSNIGLSPEVADANIQGTFSLASSLLGYAQFGLFELPAGTGYDNAKLVFAPSDFKPIGGQTAFTKTDGRNSYGYDANGDFFIDFVIPGAQGVAGSIPASYALFLQGAIRSDYTIEITQQGTGSQTTLPQNILLETLGGTINWLEAGMGVTTTLAPFATSVVGFAGQVDGQTVDNYVLNKLVSNLNAVFTAANLNVVLSTSASTFQRQDFSTVFLAGNVEPNAFFNNGQFGQSQHVDMLNVDRNDQAVVFLSSLSELGFDPSRSGIDAYVESLTAAVGRRIGELLGARIETSVTPASPSIPIMGANSPQLVTGLPYRFTNALRPLARDTDNINDTKFFIGSQNSLQLLNRIVAPRA
jgi:hypothetical protein